MIQVTTRTTEMSSNIFLLYLALPEGSTNLNRIEMLLLSNHLGQVFSCLRSLWSRDQSAIEER